MFALPDVRNILSFPSAPPRRSQSQPAVERGRQPGGPVVYVATRQDGPSLPARLCGPRDTTPVGANRVELFLPTPAHARTWRRTVEGHVQHLMRDNPRADAARGFGRDMRELGHALLVGTLSCMVQLAAGVVVGALACAGFLAITFAVVFVGSVMYGLGTALLGALAAVSAGDMVTTAAVLLAVYELFLSSRGLLAQLR